MMATFRSLARGSTRSAGFCRKRLKMTCKEANPFCSKQRRASSTVSTLAPHALILPSCCRSRSQPNTSPRCKTSVGTQWSCVRSRASTPRRLSEASVAARKPAAVYLSGNSAPVRPSFVATKRLPPCRSLRKLPMSSSLRPLPYTSAVSKNVVPASAAASRMRKAVRSSRSPQSEPPSCQQPRPTSETWRPVSLKMRFFIGKRRWLSLNIVAPWQKTVGSPLRAVRRTLRPPARIPRCGRPRGAPPDRPRAGRNPSRA